jgi:hypothetical protein
LWPKPSGRVSVCVTTGSHADKAQSWHTHTHACSALRHWRLNLTAARSQQQQLACDSHTACVLHPRMLLARAAAVLRRRTPHALPMCCPALRKARAVTSGSLCSGSCCWAPPLPAHARQLPMLLLLSAHPACARPTQPSTRGRVRSRQPPPSAACKGGHHAPRPRPPAGRRAPAPNMCEHAVRAQRAHQHTPRHTLRHSSATRWHTLRHSSATRCEVASQHSSATRCDTQVRHSSATRCEVTSHQPTARRSQPSTAHSRQLRAPRTRAAASNQGRGRHAGHARSTHGARVPACAAAAAATAAAAAMGCNLWCDWCCAAGQERLLHFQQLRPLAKRAAPAVTARHPPNTCARRHQAGGAANTPQPLKPQSCGRCWQAALRCPVADPHGSRPRLCPQGRRRSQAHRGRRPACRRRRP